MNLRIGNGIDFHKTAPGSFICLGGIQIPAPFALVGHSDADILLHATVDAILGALGKEDIGYHFSNKNQKNKNRASSEFLNFANQIMKQENWNLNNLDATIIAEQPQISPHRNLIRNKMADLLNIAVDQISVKATTTEKVGFLGRSEGLVAFVTVLLIKN